MSHPFLKTWAHKLFERILYFNICELDDNALKKSAIVFSPHPDDETLGCGGTIIKKIKKGADMNLVFIADGTSSHSHLVEEEKLKAIRESEALAAGRVLGLKKEKIIFLEFRDGELNKNQDYAARKVTKILLREKPEEIFMPYKKEKLCDHSITHQIIISALQMYKKKAIIYEYPIWFWHHWPWVRVPIKNCKDISTVLRNSLFSANSFLKDLRYAVSIEDVLECKRTALDQYKSQMTRLIPHTCWLTLNDISQGEFIACFFKKVEIFHRYNFFPE